MLSLKPVPENKASREVGQIYTSIKQTFGLSNVPVIFQYLAVFPVYLEYIWTQALKNLNDPEFKREAQEIENFAQSAMHSIYFPGSLTKLFLEKIGDRAERLELTKFVNTATVMNSQLYLLSLAIRESLKGKYLGVKQIGEHLDKEEKTAFEDLSEGFFKSPEGKDKRSTNVRIHTSTQISPKSSQGITTSVYAEFFAVMEKEMEKLVKNENYLTRRVELERYTLSRLQLLPHPLDSSITTIFKQAYDNPQFPELIYLVGDLFPTQTPFKLLASAVMKESLRFKSENGQEENSNAILLPPKSSS